ncbi:excalibur calcium-binding domain-containing protein [Aquimonas sp.]|jgi:hypothetical protein|uniref:excalibur calcium-binding domain-containing protein n=1 Tax=Aquimonas sp. TaxID=1872588 RepID=UPI0037BF4C48
MKNCDQMQPRCERASLRSSVCTLLALGLASPSFAQSTPYGICPPERVTVSGPQREWRDLVTGAYVEGDLDRVWWLMLPAAAAGAISIYPNGGILLTNFLTSGGDWTANYVGLNVRAAWISQASAVVLRRAEMDVDARYKAIDLFEGGSSSGAFEIASSVVTEGSVDPDLYFALGKFNMTGEYKYSFRRPWGARAYLKLERVYRATDRYDWDPPRMCGIIDHVVPWSLAQAGKAKDFDVKILWGEPEFKLDLKFVNCAEVRAAGKAPILRGQAGFGPHLDLDNDGIGCE